MNGGHQAVGDAELVIQYLGDGGQAVGGAGGIGDKVHAGVIGLVVDAHDEGGRHIILGWGGDDHLFCPALKVQRAQLLSVERACGLNNVLGSAVRPGDFPMLILLRKNLGGGLKIRSSGKI